MNEGWVPGGVHALRSLLAAALVLLTPLAGCLGGDAEDAPDVLADVYPTAYLAERLLGGGLTVGGIVPEGQDPHEWEPSPRDVTRVADARVLVVSAAGTEPWLHRLLESLGSDAPPVVRLYRNVTLLPPGEAHDAHGDPHADDHHEEHGDAHDEHEEGAADPHVWFDPVRMANASRDLAADLAAALPDHAATINASLPGLVADLDALHAEYAAGLATCDVRTLIVTHNALAYLSDRYHVGVRAFAGAASEAEPSPAEVAAIADAARELGIDVVFYEDVQGQRAMNAVAEEIGGSARRLHTIEARAPGVDADYLDLMRENLANFRVAMECATP